MVRVRKLVLAIAAASALTSGTAHALGLGEIDLQSSLSQPLVAEIELLEVRDLAPGEVIPALASAEEFNKAGVDRQYFLTDLKFTPIIKPNGKSVIRITSTKPVREPYVNFLVEVLWPNGRLLREYTLLLDPPLYSPTPALTTAPSLPVAAAPAPRPQAAAPTPRPVTPSASAPARPAAPVAPAAPAPAAPVKAAADQYKTTSSDTLWEIAQSSRQGGSVHQAMLAIQELNPNAFIGGNINRLKSGQVLRLPTDAQIKSRSQAEALAQVAEQNAAWREGRSVAASSSRQLDATKRDSAGAAPAKAEAKDSLKLVSADSGKSTAGTEKGKGDSKALNDQLAVTKESLDSTRRENEELKSRLGDLQSQLDKAQRLLELKDSQLAKLQADLAKQGQAAAAPSAEAKPQEVKPAAPVAEAKPAEVKPVEKPAATDFNYEEPAPKVEPAKPAAQAPAPQPAKPAAAKPEQPAKPVTKPVVKESEPQGMLDQLLANPMLLGAAGGGVLLALLIGLMVLSRRNAMKEAELQNSLSAEQGDDAFASDMDLPDDSFAGLDDAADQSAIRGQAEERVAPQTADALGEADIYIAYGKFSQAAELLHNAINDEPQRGDLRLKLMEVYAELGDRDGFARQEQELREIGGSAGAVDQLKAKYPAMAAAALAGGAAVAAADELDSFSLDDLTLDEPASPQPAAADLDDAFDLSLDELDVNLDEPTAQSTPAAEATLDDLELDAGLDFDAPAAPASTVASDMDFDLDLGGDAAAESLSLGDDLADFSLDLEAESKPAAFAEDDFMLSLDDEPIAPAAEVELEMPADFDLSLADEAPAAPVADSFAAQLDEVSAELNELSGGLADELPAARPEASSSAAGLDVDDDFDFLSGTDETATKLDLARAYIDMGDSEGARDILDEVIAEGNEGQQQEARELIAKLS
ncbi:peptigoglycan-binding protein LysM [Aquipseudomonas alcaligenes]|uniref:Peptigoglycan-binding protein LysM n=1 Tax=Aquipseudomonas alcaligenes TaxID=43263 RepID=A0A2V4L844_AQUAC|nr:FimV/HubP family polar landmark protein [Pseudomonas alcaligenes]PYC25722.1 peptigoglycan-binding protein LysM [Pseudomonas alcaligenes]